MERINPDEELHIEVERENSTDIVELIIGKHEDPLGTIRSRLGLGNEALLFERDGDEPLTAIEGRRNLRVLAHSSRAITVTVRYEHKSEDHKFPPSATVFRVLQWAVGKKGFNLDPTNAARANLMLPGADEPLPRDRTIGAFTTRGSHSLVLDLTLKDFTNG